MSERTNGYVDGIDYIYGYHSELNPVNATLALLNAGFAPPRIGSGASCELGFGFGVSANLHAAASGSEWWGTDFNFTQARFAQGLAQASGANAQLFDASFTDFCHRTDLPEFDFIGLHGIWSWVSDESRQLIVDFVRRRLRVGGVLYVSYNTQPGVAQMVPVREMMMEHIKRMSAPGIGIAAQIESAVACMNELLDASPGYGAVNPMAAARIKELKGHSANYLAHEYFNRDWKPMLHAEFCNWFESAKLSFSCSALYSDHFDVFNLTPVQVEVLGQITEATFQRSARDFLVNRQFRKDYWIREPQRLGATERTAALRMIRVVLITYPDKIVFRASGSLTEQDLPLAIYQPVLDLLSDFKIHSLGDMEKKLHVQAVSFSQLVEAIMVLIGKGDVACAQEDWITERALMYSVRLNQHLIESSIHGSSVTVLASPVTGGGIYVQPFHQQMLLARSRGMKSLEQCARFLWQNLQANGRGLVNTSGGIMSEQESLAALLHEAEIFANQQLPILQALKVVR